MSEFINNQEHRQNLLKDLIRKIHDGLPLEEAKQEFKKHFKEVSTDEILKMEQALIKEGMSIAEVQKLCDVHAAVFEGSISDIHRPKDIVKDLGHPLQVFLEENEKIEKVIKEEIEPYLLQSGKSALLMLRVAIDRLSEIDKHYKRKELLFFPNLEKKNITAPPKVMWGVDDEIRTDLKEVQNKLNDATTKEEEVKSLIVALIQRVRDMIVKENNILAPMLVDNLSYFDWILVDASSEEVGYFLEKPHFSWKKKKPIEAEDTKVLNTDKIRFASGSFEVEELEAMLNTLPFDITFVDKEGHVKYFSQGKERFFERPLTILGRHVNMCHPPASVHIVEEIIEDFKSGRKDHEDFWIKLKEAYILIRYFAVRDKENSYLGTLEVTQDIKNIKALEGEKRLKDN